MKIKLDLFILLVGSLLFTIITCDYLVDYIKTVDLLIVFYIGYFAAYFLAFYSSYSTLLNFIERKINERKSISNKN